MSPDEDPAAPQETPQQPREGAEFSAPPASEQAPETGAAPSEQADTNDETVVEPALTEENTYQQPTAGADFGELEPEPSYEDAHAYEDEAASPHLFSTPAPEPEIPLPGEDRFDPRRARDAQVNLDLDLARIKRRKRYGLFLTSLGVLFVALFVAPVTWALAYLFFDPPSTVLMLERAAEGQSIRHTPVPITRMSPFIVRSVIAAEDANFCTHHGFDVAAIQDAMESNADGGKVRGGSTISQQTAKNLFLWPQRSWVRKGFETYFTALIEFMWPKRRIMEA
jgi:hypothetical protein